MLPIRATFRGASGARLFSTTRGLRVDLSYQVFGPEKAEATQSPIVFLHGLFGSKQNNRGISKALARDLNREIFTLDLRNHGQSFHSEEHNYSAMAEDVVKFLQQLKLDKCVLIGHSMGAKAAMTVALDSPKLVSALVPVDNAPVNAPLKSDFGLYIRGMQHVEAANVTKQSEADEILKGYESSLPIRQFLLTNLVRSQEDQTMKFRVPLAVLGDAIPAMADFPYREPGAVSYDGPTLFVRGTKSKYVSDDTVPAIKKFFPNAQIADVEAGHWLISENPEAFRQAVVKFLQKAR
ncbi:hypothetical protein ASPCADRAFT_519313 [Aspergillus carbonarius ITEM 5010]|uniref:AB hydrolase-1 domain-containing protein n=1 Tax=Aspergillus carbonarius (strain ITEM 5010) TaxID=602072 RepID=A0A1R3R749_ASPC5|nr:hypothetical protein ASPCADRAFT_519313 [Aspergillus carbonarius ITEM 5010]